MKKQKHFYSHIVSIDSVHVEISYLDITTDEKKHLSQLAESTLHHAILDAVLSDLSPEDKKVFLRQLHLDDHLGIWRFLNKKTKKAEMLIRSIGEELLEKLHADIKAAKST